MIRSLDRSSTKIFLFSGINNDRSISVEEKKQNRDTLWYRLTTDILIAFASSNIHVYIFRQTRLIIAWIEDRSRRKESTRMRTRMLIRWEISIILLNSHDCINIFNYIFFDEYKERITTVWKLRIIRLIKIYL